MLCSPCVYLFISVYLLLSDVLKMKSKTGTAATTQHSSYHSTQTAYHSRIVIVEQVCLERTGSRVLQLLHQILPLIESRFVLGQISLRATILSVRCSPLCCVLDVAFGTESDLNRQTQHTANPWSDSATVMKSAVRLTHSETQHLGTQQPGGQSQHSETQYCSAQYCPAQYCSAS